MQNKGLNLQFFDIRNELCAWKEFFQDVWKT